MKHILLFLIAVVLGVVFIPLGLLFSIVFRLRITINTGYDYFKVCAIAIDQAGNVFCSDLFNMLLITNKAKIKFGNPDQTISAVLGYAQYFNALTSIGKSIVVLLDTIDPYHCYNAMVKDTKWKRKKRK
jgi:hypothetical protein